MGAVALIAIVVGILYAPILSNHLSLMTDTLHPPGPSFIGDPDASGPITFMKEVAVSRAWNHFHLPIWLPNEGYGVTLAGNQAAPWFFPEILMHLLFPNNFSDWNVLALLIGCVGTYVFASRDLALSRIAATVSALAFALSGPIIANINLDMINPLVIMPLLLLTSKRLVEEEFALRNAAWWTWLAATSFLVSQLLLAGFDEVVPLELVTVGLFVLVRIATLATGPSRSLRKLVSIVAALFIGFIASAIATVSLQAPLKNYHLRQSPTAWSDHMASSWIPTLIDPWYFGKALAGGALQGLNTIWVSGNPIEFMLALAAVIALVYYQKPKGWQLWWRVTSVILVVYGILAFSNIGHVLDIMDVSPLNLIISSRFMPFMWWLPLTFLTGAGVDAIAKSKKRLAGISALTTLGVIAAFVLYAVLEGQKKFPMLSSRFLHSEIAQNGEVIGLFALFVITLFTVAPKARRGAALLGMLAMLSLLLPRNFYPTYQAPQQANSIQSALVKTGLANSLTFSPENLFLPSGLQSLNLSSVQAFDVFLPKGYVTTVQNYFGSQSESSSASPLYSFAPAMMTLAMSGNTIGDLSQMGVGAIIVPNKLNCASTTKYATGPEPANLSIPSVEYRRAVDTLTSVYVSRSDLVKAYPICSSQAAQADEIALLKWANHSLAAHDNAAIRLAPYLSIYSSLAAAMTTNPSFMAIETSSTIGTTADVQLATTAYFGGTQEYIYALNRAKNSTILWVPSSIKIDLAANQIIPFASQVANLSPAKGLSGAQQTTLLARLISLDSNSQTLSMKLKTNRAGLVALRQQVVPGATLSVNGKPAKLFAIDGFLDAMWVPAGVSKVVINYASSSTLALFWFDLAMNLVLFAATIAGAIILAWRKGPEHTHPRHRITGLRS